MYYTYRRPNIHVYYSGTPLFQTPLGKYKCPDYRDVVISGVNLYYKAHFGTFVSILNTGVSSSQCVLNGGVSLYTHVGVCRVVVRLDSNLHLVLFIQDILNSVTVAYIHVHVHVY